MNRQDNFGTEMNKQEKGEEMELKDPALEAVLRDFHNTVHAWSEAAYSEPQLVFSPEPRRTLWRKSVVWVCSLTLAAGLAGSGLYERHHKQVLARQAAQREAQHQLQLAEQRARELDELVAELDSDVSQQVPDAMQPLASLMDDQGQ